MPPLGAIALHSLFLYSDTPPPCPSSVRLAQTSFEPNLYLYKYPSNLVPVILVHTTYEDGTEYSETSTHTIHMPGNHSKGYNIPNMVKVMFGFYSPYWKKLLEVVAFSVQMHITPNKYIVQCVLKFCWWSWRLRPECSSLTLSLLWGILVYIWSFDMPHQKKLHGFKFWTWRPQSSMCYSVTGNTLNVPRIVCIGFLKKMHEFSCNWTDDKKWCPNVPNLSFWTYSLT